MTVLVSLTDRIDARRIVIAFCLVAAVSSIGSAWLAQDSGARSPSGRSVAWRSAAYMPGLKALTHRIEGPRKTRYQSFYTASFLVGSSVSLLMTGVLAERHGWPLAFAAAGRALLAVLVLASGCHGNAGAPS